MPAPAGSLILTLLIDVGERINLADAEARLRSAGRQGLRPVLRRTEARGLKADGTNRQPSPKA